MIHRVIRTILIAFAAVRAIFVASPAEQKKIPARKSRKLVAKAVEYVVVFGVLGILGFLGAASGIIPIRASAGHWPITRWFLDFSMHRSLSTHSIGVEVPRLDDPSLVLKGAGAYESNCRWCHGSPDLPRPRVSGAMLPQPRYLPDVVAKWSDAELFTVVKHGVKFTGMPAWPAQQRDDEVWAIVAFLRRFPEMSADDYRRHVVGRLPEDGRMAPRGTYERCGRCHGADGQGLGVGAFPKLAGQRPAYLVNALEAFVEGRRHSGVMEPIAAALSVRDRHEIAAYYSRRIARSAPILRVNDSIVRGRNIAMQGIPAQRVPPCVECHGPSAHPKNDAYPILAGQYADYLVLQLELFRQERRGGSRYAHLMRPVAAGLSAQQIRDVAAYYESLGGGSHGGLVR